MRGRVVVKVLGVVLAEFILNGLMGHGWGGVEGLNMLYVAFPGRRKQGNHVNEHR